MGCAFSVPSTKLPSIGTAALHNLAPPIVTGVSFWTWQLLVAVAINAVVQAIQIGAYAARLAGVRTGRIATSISLFNLFVTASRLAMLVYTLMLGPISDAAGHAVAVLQSPRAHALWSSAALQADIASIQTTYQWQLRAIIFGGLVGTLLGALLLPMFTYLYVRGVRSFERTKSLPHSMLRLLDFRVLGDVLSHIRLPRLAEFRTFSTRGIPRRLLVFNVVVTGVYAVGVVAAYYASVIDINVARTAIGTSGIINGVGTIAFTFFVDPTSSIIVDEAVKGERPHEQVKSMVFYLALTAAVGWALSQLILVPSAEIIAFVAHLVNHGR
ncbi:MAG: lipid II flippase Amj family protein [Candidatus Eremiobacteraeota bacterium]|nr:lipid II flippase Amj family protein [Candidatus Eremiobacteraeota bacterium]